MKCVSLEASKQTERSTTSGDGLGSDTGCLATRKGNPTPLETPTTMKTVYSESVQAGSKQKRYSANCFYLFWGVSSFSLHALSLYGETWHCGIVQEYGSRRPLEDECPDFSPCNFGIALYLVGTCLSPLNATSRPFRVLLF